MGIDPTAVVGKGCIIDPGSVLRRGVKIGNNVHIYDGVVVDEDAQIENNSVIGYPNLTKKRCDTVRASTYIGKRSIVRTNSVIYQGCRIGHDTWINHNVVLREETVVGDHTTIGCLTKCEGYTTIGSFCAIHAQCHLTALLTVQDYVFFGAAVITTNGDRIDHYRRFHTEEKGPTVEIGARIGSGVILLPKITIGREALIGAGAVVTKDIPAFKIAYGVPARVVGDVPEEERLPVDI